MKLVLVFQICFFMVFGGFSGALHNRIVELEKRKAYSTMLIVMDINQLGDIEL